LSLSHEPLQERRRRLVRDEIRRVAIELFAERGFDAVTVEDIAAAAGTSPRTFFRYFATKDEVVLDYERRLIDRLVAGFDEQPASLGGVAALRQAYIATSHIVPADRDRFVKLGRIHAMAPSLGARARAERQAFPEDLVGRVAQRLGVPASDVAARTVVAAVGAVAAAEYAAWVADGGRDDPADRIAAALALLEQGLGSLDAARARRTRRSP
jgi:AcrR family transcriptional regulator